MMLSDVDKQIFKNPRSYFNKNWLPPYKIQNRDMDYFRPLKAGEVTQIFDYMKIGNSLHRITPCKYDPGCCVSVAVIESGLFFRYIEE